MKRLFALLMFVVIFPNGAFAANWSIRHNFELKEYHEKKEIAERHIQKVMQEMQSLPANLDELLAERMRSLAVVEKTKAIWGLADLGNETFTAFRPLGSCRAVADSARSLWLEATKRELSPKNFLLASAHYAGSLQRCQNEIDIPPNETITVTGPASKSSELPGGCLLVFNVKDPDPVIATHTCPAEVEKDLLKMMNTSVGEN